MDGFGIPQENAGIPEKLAAFHKFLCKFQIRFFGKGFHLSETFFVFSARLYITVAYFGTVGFYAEGKQYVVFRDMFQTFLYCCEEFVFFCDKMVGRRDYHVGFRVAFAYMCKCVCYARGGVPACRFEQYLFFVHFRQLLHNQSLVCLVGYYKYVFLRDYAREAVECHLQQRTPRTAKIKELFGTVVAAVRPKTAAHATRHYDAKVLSFHFRWVDVLVQR